MGAHGMLRLNLAAGFYHTVGSTTGNYLMVAGRRTFARYGGVKGHT